VRATALALALIAGLQLPCAAGSQRSAAEIMDILMWGREPVGGPFSLIDQSGKIRTNEDFRGKLMLIYFGFTYCPDICPTDLQNIGLALDQLGPDGDKVQPLFITLDPERDTAEHLKEYLSLFHSRIIGLTGDAAAIGATADAFKVYYARVSNKQGDDYTIDHTAFIYLMGVDGNYLGFFPPGTSSDRIAETLRKQVAQNQ
jgi:cytochrome oxidase Cu insertion factor (SCO1/SenC/PrrC family)